MPGDSPHSGEWLINIKRDLKHLTEGRRLSRKFRKTIFRIRPRLRELRREQFEFEHLSLGLYDRSGNDFLKPKTKGDSFRLAVVCTFLVESGKTADDWETICEKIVPHPEEMQEQYDEEGLEDLSKDDVRSVLSLDAIFLACFLGAISYGDSSPEFSPFYENIVSGESDSFLSILMDDVIKLENQIPLTLIRNALLLLYETLEERRGSRRPAPKDDFLDCGFHSQESRSVESCVLISPTKQSDDIPDEPDEVSGRLIEPTKAKSQRSQPLLPQDAAKEDSMRNEDRFSTKADETLQSICSSVASYHHSSSLPGFQRQDITFKYDVVFGEKCEHLLHCLYLAILQGPNPTAEAFPKPYACRILWGAMRKGVDFCFRRRKTNQPGNTSGRMDFQAIPLPSASQLSKAGIVFRGQVGSFADVKFKMHLSRATLFLPKIDFVGDNCEPLWRNLVAFEDEHESQHEFKSYLDFMDDLIDAEKDVAMMRRGRHPVIVSNGLGSDGDVATLFNSMLMNYPINRSEKWQALRKQIVEFYSNEKRRNWIEFVKTEFGKPWLAISVVAAFVVLILTFLQTFYAMLSYYK